MESYVKGKLELRGYSLICQKWLMEERSSPVSTLTKFNQILVSELLRCGANEVQANYGISLIPNHPSLQLRKPLSNPCIPKLSNPLASLAHRQEDSPMRLSNEPRVSGKGEAVPNSSDLMLRIGPRLRRPICHSCISRERQGRAGHTVKN